MEKRTEGRKVIAVCGKGGAGKTAVSAGLVRLFAKQHGQRLLAVDADPAVGLAACLDVTPKITLNDIRTEVIERARGREGIRELERHVDYRLFEALVETQGFCLIAVGRPEEEGCYCSVNDLLRDAIAALADDFDVTVIDGEAGVEQINRRVMETVTHLLLVSDVSARGINVARTIRDVASRAMPEARVGIILNRLRGEGDVMRVTLPKGIPLLGWLPEDEAIRDSDARGISILDLSDCPFLTSLERCAEAFGVI